MDFSFFVGLLMIVQVSGDCYLQNPRGSNNRLNEKSANRNNGNRLFDSQNNNRGGFNVGDLSEAAFTEGNTGQGASSTVFGANVNALDQGQYSMMFFEKSKFVVEWTNQHGCGGNEATDANKLNCNLVFQYGWQTKKDHADMVSAPQLWLNLKSGRNTNTPGTANTINDFATQHTTNDNNGNGRHESEAWYYMCEKIYRNKGLFLADQNVKGESAQYTRQNPNGNRRGLECPEERDYYPYWQPTPWVDLAVLTDTVADCTARFNFEGESQNVKDKWACLWTGTTPNEECYKYYDNMTKCTEMGCQAKAFNHGVNKPRCEQAPWTRANSLGNGRDGQPTTLNITFPALSNTAADGVGKYTDIRTVGGKKITKGILRIRYNISTDDYDVAQINASQNYNLNAKPEPIVSPVTQNPTVDIGLDSLQGLRLAINTNQFGRTFQDRTHVFYLMENTEPNTEIQNVVVRGKRGNIVQTFPAIEYDFAPKAMEWSSSAAKTQIVHMQWTGSNTHNNGNPAGDGQAGDAGEGTTGTDRHNLMPLETSGGNYPPPFAKAAYKAGNIFEHWPCKAPKATVTGTGTTSTKDWSDLGYQSVEKGLCALRMTSGGYYNTFAEASTKASLSVLLNNAPASLVGGQLLYVPAGATAKQDYHFMCTRNNNFSNRSQKGTFTVIP